MGTCAGTSKRVKLPGYRVINSAAEANKFTVAKLIQGGTWLKSSSVAYTVKSCDQAYVMVQVLHD